MSRFETSTLRKLAWSIGASSTVLFLGAFTFVVVDRHANLPPDLRTWDVPDVLDLFTNMAVPLLGLLLAIRRPRNPIGWLFLVAGAGLALSAFSEGYTVHALRVAHASWPLVRFLGWLDKWVWPIAVTILILLLLTFPDGALRSRRWRPVAWLAVTAGASILSGTSTRRRVIIDLDAARQSQVKVGDKVTITLPDGQTTPGVVSSVGSVATTASDQQDAGPTIPVEVTPTHPSATGQLDQAPVLVSITTASVKDVLVVPVDALIALAGGGYAVEVDEGGSRHLVPVTLGIFDSAEGLVEVSGAGLEDGQRVVVPAS